MPKYSIIKLKEMSPLHIGTGKENYDFSASTLHSDTLSAALASIRVKVGGKTDIEKFLNSFTISSAFPYSREHYFLPRPQKKVNVTISDIEEYTSRKKLKNIRYIDSKLWYELLKGNNVIVNSNQIQGNFLLDAVDKDFRHPYKSVVNQRVSVPRDENKDAEPFFFDWTFFNEDSGLYCITDATGDLLNEIVNLFEILGEIGIGTDKNVGGGKFSVDTELIEFPDITEQNSVVLLSLYIPHEEDMPIIDLDQSHFELVLRSGYISGSSENKLMHLRKKSIYTFGVGSILRITGKIKGKVVDLQPTDYNDERMHPVYRSGKPFVLPINIAKNE